MNLFLYGDLCIRLAIPLLCLSLCGRGPTLRPTVTTALLDLSKSNFRYFLRLEDDRGCLLAYHRLQGKFLSEF